MFIRDESQDKKYFTMIPNFILNHSTANDQALYLQMKRIAGESGICFASKRYMMKQLGIGRAGLNKSLKYLIDHEWIKFAGNKKVRTPGGIQEIATYGMADLWSKNINHFEGASETTPLEDKVRLKNHKVRLKRPQGASETTTKKNLKKNHKKKEKNLNKILEKMKKELIEKKVIRY